MTARELVRSLVAISGGSLSAPWKRRLAQQRLMLSTTRSNAKSAPFRGQVLDFELEAYSRDAFVALFDDVFATGTYLFESDNPQPRILDCGSNIGFSVAFFKALYPQASIVAFEPSASAFKMLQANIARNRLNDVQAHQLALGAVEGPVDFYIDPENPGSLTMSTLRERLSKEKATVQQACLSRFVDGPVDLLKLDVEGVEDAVLGDLVASGRIDRIKEMAIEYHHHIAPKDDHLGSFLGTLERSGFGYQIRSSVGMGLRASAPGEFQDLLIRAYRK